MEEKSLPSTQRARIFQKSALVLAAAFFLIMVFVVVVAFTKKSGSTGMDPAKIQMDRTKFHQKMD